MKLPGLDEYGKAAYWVGHPDCYQASPVEKLIIDNRDRVELLGTIEDAEASYSYDDFALIRLDADYYLLNTSGCSCPSPSETWNVEIGPATLDEIEVFIRGGNYQGYTVPKKQMDEFLAALDAARKEKR